MDVSLVGRLDIIILRILSNLDRKDLCCSATRVCSQWNRLVNNASLWHTVVVEFFEDYSDNAVSYRDEKILSAIHAVCDHSEAIRSLTFEIPETRDNLVAAFQSEIQGLSFHRLTYLSLACNPWLTTPTFDVITRGTRDLKWISLEMCHRLTDDCIAMIGERCPQLQSLCLRCCSGISDAALYQLFSTMPSNPQLRTFNAVQGPELSDRTVVRMAERLSDKLTKLKCNATHLTDSAVANGVILLHGMTYLSLENAILLTDASLDAISKSLRSLTHFYMSKADNVSSAGLRKFFSTCAHLSRSITHLKLIKIPAMNSYCTFVLANSFPTLQLLSLDDCYSVDEEGICEIRNKCRQLFVLSLSGLYIDNRAFLNTNPNSFPSLVLLYLHGCHNVVFEGLTRFTTRSPDPVFIQCPGGGSFREEKFVRDFDGKMVRWTEGVIRRALCRGGLDAGLFA